MSMHIRRDRSSLHFGRRSRLRRRAWLFWAWFLTMLFALGIIWQFQRVQPKVLSMVLGPPTATPDGIFLAQQAQDAYWAGDLDKSIELYGQAAALEPANMDIQFEYVRNLVYGSYAGRGYVFRSRNALEVAERAVELAPDDARAQAAYALALIENDRPDEAALAALTATELAPGWAEARAYLSLAYYGQGRYQSAQEQAALAIQIDANSIDAHRVMALAIAFVGDYNGAIRQYEQAISIHPRLDALYFELAPYYIILDNYEAAIQAYDRVLANDPRNVKAWTRKCETFFRQRDDAAAQESCEQAIDLDSNFPEAHRQLGMVRYTRRNYEGAIESFERCIDLMDAQGWAFEDREIECYYLHGLAYYLLDDCTEAWPLLQEALLLNPAENIRNSIMQGINACVSSDDSITIEDIPTPVVPTEVPPDPIGIY